MIRTFIAIEIPQDIKEEISGFQNSLKDKNFPVRWVRPENIHITLKFVGEIPGEVVNNIKQEFEKSPPLIEPFSCTVGGTGVFPNLKRPRVFWAGIKNGAEETIALAGTIDRFVREFDIEREKKRFSPHLTIGRFKRPFQVTGLENFLSDDILNTGNFSVGKIVFMQSVLKPLGPEYTPLAYHSLSSTEKPGR